MAVVEAEVEVVVLGDLRFCSSSSLSSILTSILLAFLLSISDDDDLLFIPSFQILCRI